MVASRAVVCEGAGYRLRPLCEQDAQALAVFSLDEHYFKYLMEGPRSPEQVRDFVSDAVAKTSDPQGLETWWAVESSHANTFIGTANVKYVGAPADRHGSAGCALSPEAQGHGMGKKLGWDMIGIAFEHFGFHRLELTCAFENEASFHIMNDVYGFTYEGVRREHALTSRGWWSSHVFSILEDEYAALKESKFQVP